MLTPDPRPPDVAPHELVRSKTDGTAIASVLCPYCDACHQHQVHMLNAAKYVVPPCEISNRNAPRGYVVILRAAVPHPLRMEPSVSADTENASITAAPSARPSAANKRQNGKVPPVPSEIDPSRLTIDERKALLRRIAAEDPDAYVLIGRETGVLRRTTATGRSYVYRPDHPRARKSDGFVRVIVLAAESKLGRPLAARESVWPINGDPTDLRHCNLHVISRHEFPAYTSNLARAAFEHLRTGAPIVWDAEAGAYRAVKPEPADAS